MGMWMVRLDSDGDSLPDGDDYPYGYYDSVYNSVQHTYAIAKFYRAYLQLAELERFSGFESEALFWEQRAATLRQAFHRPLEAGGYWLAGQTWPIAWQQADGSTMTGLETFGVFAALRSGLLGPQDGQRYRLLVETLHSLLPELIAGPSPLKLMVGGYEPAMRREVDPPVPLWMMDASAPWISGLAAPAYAAAGYPEDAQAVMQAYMAMAHGTQPPVLEFAAGPEARFGPGNSGDGGRTWDSAAWFLAVYGGHYGIRMTPEALVVQPQPFTATESDGIVGLSYQGAVLQMSLNASAGSYQLQTSRPVVARLLPVGAAPTLRLNGGEPQASALLLLEPGQVYRVESE
jgi:hypothetical protein